MEHFDNALVKYKPLRKWKILFINKSSPTLTSNCH